MLKLILLGGVGEIIVPISSIKNFKVVASKVQLTYLDGTTEDLEYDNYEALNVAFSNQ